jgi:hypothetical protein
MPTLSSGLLRAGLALKLSQIKLATRSYLRDRTNQATGTVSSYAIGAGLFAAAGVFLIAACGIGLTALFRWIEVKYGLFFALGAAGALLLVLAAICAALAVISLTRKPPQFPSLTSRLRVAIRANPIAFTADPVADQFQAARDTARADVISASPMVRWLKAEAHSEPGALQISAGIVVVATLLGWALTRRWQQSSGRR